MVYLNQVLLWKMCREHIEASSVRRSQTAVEVAVCRHVDIRSKFNYAIDSSSL